MGGPSTQLPDYLMGESNRPDEPITEGLPFGPGGGPEVIAPPEQEDFVQVMLERMVEWTGDANAAQMLDDHREFKTFRSQKANPSTPPLAAPQMQAPTPEPQDLVPQDLEFDEMPTEEEVVPAGEEESPEPSVETPAEPLPTELEI